MAHNCKISNFKVHNIHYVYVNRRKGLVGWLVGWWIHSTWNLCTNFNPFFRHPHFHNTRERNFFANKTTCINENVGGGRDGRGKFKSNFTQTKLLLKTINFSCSLNFIRRMSKGKSFHFPNKSSRKTHAWTPERRKLTSLKDFIPFRFSYSFTTHSWC